MNKNGLFSLAFHTLFSVFLAAPLVIVCLVAFTPGNMLSVPTLHFSVRWFVALFNDNGFITAFCNSMGLATLSATGAALLGVPAAMGLLRYNFPGRAALNGLLLSPLMIPPVVLGVALLRLFNGFGVNGSFTSLVLAHVMLIFPYSLRLIMASMVSLSREPEHAAMSLGANAWTTFRRITLPALLPGILGGWVLAFASSFDELTATIFLASPATITLPVRIYMSMTETVDPMVAAVAVVIIVITLGLMFLLDRLVGLDKVLMGKN
ncbi:ABC transporter permease [Pseudomonas frederiksbergensis]|uniref:ABC transporter permease n=1 Tax=Pseudomonas frederiksbergensis TaxID=104087 RepID=UPI003D06D89A